MSVSPIETRVSRVLPALEAAAWLRRACMLALGLLVLAGWTGRAAAAESLEDRYLAIVSLIQEADVLATDAKTEPALVKYRQALTQLQAVQRTDRNWNAKTVNFRLNYLAQKIADLSPKETPASSASSPPAKTLNPLKLAGNGSEPRQELRLHPKAGDKQTLTLSMKMATEVKIGELPAQAVKLPETKMVMELTVKDVSSAGEIAYDLVVTDVSVAEDPDALPQVAEALRGQFGRAKGMSGSGTLSSRGFGKPVELKGPSGGDAQTREALGQIQSLMQGLVPKLPEEAVGVGAKWEVQAPIQSQGMTLQQTQTYEVTSLDNDRLGLKTTVVQSASNQKVSNPAMPGVKVDLTRMTGKGTGTGTLELSRVMPLKSIAENHADFDMAMDMAGQKQAMTMKMNLTFQVESK